MEKESEVGCSEFVAEGKVQFCVEEETIFSSLVALLKILKMKKVRFKSTQPENPVFEIISTSSSNLVNNKNPEKAELNH